MVYSERSGLRTIFRLGDLFQCARDDADVRVLSSQHAVTHFLDASGGVDVRLTRSRINEPYVVNAEGEVVVYSFLYFG